MSRPERDPIGEAHRQWVAHGWADAADGMAMVTSVVRVHQLLHQRIDLLLRPLELTFARYEVLRLLSFARDGQMAMTRLGSLLQVHPTTVTSAVDRLERQDFVRRERSAPDRRVVLASLTPTGSDVLDRATTGLNQIFAAPGLPPTQVTALTGLLTDLRAGLGDLPGPRSG